MKALSLFSGAGGFDLGARMAGLDVVASVERDALACEALGLNGFHAVQGDVTELDFTAWRGVDVVFGGPPCQGHSRANHAGVGRERNALVREMIRAARETGAREVLIENVSTFDRTLLNEVLRELAGLGYWVATEILNAADYGVPQTRARRIIRAVRSTWAVPWPEPTHAGRHVLIDTTLADLWPELERCPLPAWMERRPARPGARLVDRQNHPVYGTGGRDGHEPAQTVTQGVHYWRWLREGETGKLGLKASARLQSFPDDYRFVGGVGARSLQIANAVPPLLGWHLLRGVA